MALGLATACLVEVWTALGDGEGVEIGSSFALVLASFGVVGWVFINLALGLATTGMGTLGGGGNLKFGFILNLHAGVELVFGFLASGGNVLVQKIFSGCLCFLFPVAICHSSVSDVCSL